MNGRQQENRDCGATKKLHKQQKDGTPADAGQLKRVDQRRESGGSARMLA